MDFSVSIPPDEDGFTNRECPNPNCESYFKIEFGTGLDGDELPCHCPYCGHIGPHDEFWTKEQIEYAESIALRKMTDALHRELKGLEFNHRPRGGFGIGISMKIKRGPRMPIRYYCEKRLETEVVCSACTLRYSVYGVFAFCPDCGQHNSLQILEKNLELMDKMLTLASEIEEDVRKRLVENALEDCVSAFDGFGRELCKVHAASATNPDQAANIRFQNLDGARRNLLNQFSIDLHDSVSDDTWSVCVKSFQKRHLLAHRMGVVDEEYVSRTGDPDAVVGRKINITKSDVEAATAGVRSIGVWLADQLSQMGQQGASP